MRRGFLCGMNKASDVSFKHELMTCPIIHIVHIVQVLLLRRVPEPSHS